MKLSGDFNLFQIYLDLRFCVVTSGGFSDAARFELAYGLAAEANVRLPGINPPHLCTSPTFSSHFRLLSFSRCCLEKDSGIREPSLKRESHGGVNTIHH